MEYPHRVLGADVSKWQDDDATPQQIDFKQMKSQGVQFVFIKATDGLSIDPDFEYNWLASHEAGLLRGPYHYMRSKYSAHDQAHHFASTVAFHPHPAELPYQLDNEERHWQTYRPLLTPQLILDTSLTLAPLVVKAAPSELLGQYTNQSYWGEIGSPAWGIQYDLWCAQYPWGYWHPDAIELTAKWEPRTPVPWKDSQGDPIWRFWQFTNKAPGKDYGAESYSLDLNWFNGDYDALLEYCGIDPSPPSPTLEDRVEILEHKVARLEEFHPEGPPVPPGNPIEE